MNEREIQVEIMHAARLDDEEILRLAWLKQQVKAGRRDELTMEYKRRLFLKHLYEVGALQE
jgi:hypothetical protein